VPNRGREHTGFLHFHVLPGAVVPCDPIVIRHAQLLKGFEGLTPLTPLAPPL
jgi:hypothetical protein